jgi:probable rRNA maturation factor
MNPSQARTAVPQITVRNLQRAVLIDVGSLQEFARCALRLCLRIRRSRRTDLMRLGEISVLIISDRRMAALHRKFRRQSGPTDVLTFQHGEIFVGAETARRHARRFRNSLVNELGLYIVHGLLHLHGFDDENERDAQRMRTVQERILKAI